MQERTFAAIEGPAHQEGGEVPGMAAAARLRMRGDAAQLDISRNSDALACHGNEATAVADTEVGAEYGSAQAEAAGVGRRHEFQHGFDIRLAQADNRARIRYGA